MGWKEVAQDACEILGRGSVLMASDDQADAARCWDELGRLLEEDVPDVLTGPEHREFRAHLAAQVASGLVARAELHRQAEREWVALRSVEVADELLKQLLRTEGGR